MKKILIIVLALCLGIIIGMTISHISNKNKVYQYYFEYCLQNAVNSQMDPEIIDDVCKCTTSAIIEKSSDYTDSSEEELYSIAGMCLEKYMLRR